MTTATAEQNTDRTRWLALYVLCAGMLMIVLDATIVNVALPSIQNDLGFSQSNLAWVINAYMIPFGGLLLLGGARPAPGGRLPWCRPDHRLADARRLHDPADRRMGLGLRPHARAQRRLRRPARGVPLPPDADRQPADAAAPVPLAQRRRVERAAGAARRRHVRDVLPRRPLPAASARLQPPRRRPRLPADDDRDGDALARLLGKADHALRSAQDADPRRLPGRRRPAALRPHAGRRQLPGRPAAAVPADRRRRRHLLPGDHDPGDVP